MTEAPLISKALRLVSLALIVSTVALVAIAGYSGFQEFQALTQTLSPSSSAFQGNNPSSQGLQEQFNGSTLTISGLNIPNNMSFPLDVQLAGSVELAGTNIGNFTTPNENIASGQVQPISLSVNVDFQKALSNQSALMLLLFNSTTLYFKTDLYASIVPLLDLNLTTSSNSSIPSILGNFNLNAGSPSCSSASQGCTVPVSMSWINSSPIAFNGGLSVAVTNINGISPVPIPLNVAAGTPGNETVKLFFPYSAISSQSLSQGSQLNLAITFNAFGTNATIPESVTIP